jgi:hypothetical protein
MRARSPRWVTWAVACLLIVAAAAAGIAANVVLLGVGWQGAADPVGHFKPELGLASTTYATTLPAGATKAHSAKTRPGRAERAPTPGTTSLSTSSAGWTTVPEREPGEGADD